MIRPVWASTNLPDTGLTEDDAMERLAGIVTPNDERCHLDGNELRKAHLYDFPSVAQINKMAKLHRINLVFAITAEQEPLYARLSQHIEGATSGVLASDSSNVVDLLTSSLKDIISKVELTQRDHNSHVSALKCPDNEKDWNPVVEVYPVGRQGSLQINLECTASAAVLSQGYIVNAEACSRNGTSMCGVCECHEGFVGRHASATATMTTALAPSARTRAGRRTPPSAATEASCVRQCQCKKPTDPSQEIYGHYCQCTNYDCAVIGGELCSGHGSATATRAIATMAGRENTAPAAKTQTTARTETPGDLFEPRVVHAAESAWSSNLASSVQFFQTGEFKDQCQEECDRYNISIVKDLSIGEKPCSFLDEKDCRFDFAYEIDRDSGNVLLWAKQDLDCPEPVNTTGEF
ncbi:myospheroid, isoform A [Penaeus vannamei]|uniref:Integrin beta n=1 Tax=Penaeus vannamei TaxID=6689 RepID=A0A423TIU9_PENVA|nr:myospheroid, isoform A [Penaeus vannamei]